MDARKILQDLQYRINTTPEAGILFPADEGSEEQEPGFGLKEAMGAAAAMADIIFPTSHLTNDPKQLMHHV